MRHILLASAAMASVGFGANAHSIDLPNGHLTNTANYGFDVVGRDTLAGVQNGLYTDVWSHNGYAYVGTYQEPSCTRAGVFVVDIAQTLENYGNGVMEGAVVAEIKSAPNTRVNDVKVHTITFKNQTRDVLVATEEQCGGVTGSGKKQLGKGGISFYDVTNPLRPHAIKQHAISRNGVHNTFMWTADDGRSYGIGVDDVDINDVIIMDLTKPQSPKEVGRVGIGDWLSGSYPEIADDEQLFTGVFATPLLHDVWVMEIGGRFQAVLSYWDAGFVVLDVDDPTNAFVLGDSTYPDPDPIFGGSPGEGNAHAAVFGGDAGQYIFAGDEDFDPFRTQVISAAGVGHLATQGSGTPALVAGETVAFESTYVGLACDAVPDGSGIAIIQRGDCAFTTKVGNVELAGYEGAVVFNHSTGCEASVSMLVDGGIPSLFVPRSAGFEILGLEYDASTCTGDGTDDGDADLEGFEGMDVGVVMLDATFDGWGSFHVLNNLVGGTTTLAPPSVPGESLEDRDVLNAEYLEHIGYYAPAELTDPSLATGSGDLTMHNVEGDPITAADEPTFGSGPRAFISWYSAGMRAVEYRPGHWHPNTGGVVSWNVHEVGQFIAEDGSNFWGVHVDEIDGQQIILGSDRNTGLWIFTFDCVSQVLKDGADTGLYCRKDG